MRNSVNPLMIYRASDHKHLKKLFQIAACQISEALNVLKLQAIFSDSVRSAQSLYQETLLQVDVLGYWKFLTHQDLRFFFEETFSQTELFCILYALMNQERFNIDGFLYKDYKVPPHQFETYVSGIFQLFKDYEENLVQSIENFPIKNQSQERQRDFYLQLKDKCFTYLKKRDHNHLYDNNFLLEKIFFPSPDRLNHKLNQYKSFHFSLPYFFKRQQMIYLKKLQDHFEGQMYFYLYQPDYEPLFFLDRQSQQDHFFQMLEEYEVSYQICSDKSDTHKKKNPQFYVMNDSSLKTQKQELEVVYQEAIHLLINDSKNLATDFGFLIAENRTYNDLFHYVFNSQNKAFPYQMMHSENKLGGSLLHTFLIFFENLIIEPDLNHLIRFLKHSWVFDFLDCEEYLLDQYRSFLEKRGHYFHFQESLDKINEINQKLLIMDYVDLKLLDLNDSVESQWQDLDPIATKVDQILRWIKTLQSTNHTILLQEFQTFLFLFLPVGKEMLFNSFLMQTFKILQQWQEPFLWTVEKLVLFFKLCLQNEELSMENSSVHFASKSQVGSLKQMLGSSVKVLFVSDFHREQSFVKMPQYFPWNLRFIFDQESIDREIIQYWIALIDLIFMSEKVFFSYPQINAEGQTLSKHSLLAMIEQYFSKNVTYLKTMFSHSNASKDLEFLINQSFLKKESLLKKRDLKSLAAFLKKPFTLAIEEKTQSKRNLFFHYLGRKFSEPLFALEDRYQIEELFQYLLESFFSYKELRNQFLSMTEYLEKKANDFLKTLKNNKNKGLLSGTFLYQQRWQRDIFSLIELIKKHYSQEGEFKEFQHYLCVKRGSFLMPDTNEAVFLNENSFYEWEIPFLSLLREEKVLKLVVLSPKYKKSISTGEKISFQLDNWLYSLFLALEMIQKDSSLKEVHITLLYLSPAQKETPFENSFSLHRSKWFGQVKMSALQIQEICHMLLEEYENNQQFIFPFELDDFEAFFKKEKIPLSQWDDQKLKESLNQFDSEELSPESLYRQKNKDQDYSSVFKARYFFWLSAILPQNKKKMSQIKESYEL